MGAFNLQSAIADRKSSGWSLRARLTALLLAALIPLAGVGVYWIFWETGHARSEAEREVQVIATRVAAQTADLVGDVHGMLTVLPRLPAVQRRDRGEAERLFRELLTASPHLENVFAFTAGGALFATAVPVAPGVRIPVRDRPWFEAVVQSGQPVTSGFLIGRITGKPVAVLAHPVLDGQGRVLGVVGAALRLSAVSKKVAHVPSKERVLWAVVDREGLVLLHIDPGAAIGSPLVPLSGMLRTEAAVPGTEWRALVAIPEAVVAARVRTEMLEIGLPALLILLGATGVGFWIAYGTWRPLQDLAAAVRRIGAGEPGVRIPVEAGGEVGEVAASFAETLAALAARDADLRRRQGELTALIKANQTITSSLDLEQILQAVVREAADISGAAAVRLFLLDEDAQVLRCRVGVGLPPEVRETYEIPVGQSFSGQVAATGEPLAVADTRGDPRLWVPAHVSRYGLVSYLGLPVKRGERTFGVLVFDTKSPHIYSQDEITFLSTFAQQAAIAIVNARLHSAAVRRGEELGALLRATHTVMAGLDLQGMLDRILAEAAHVSGSPHVKVLLVNQTAGILRVRALQGTAMPLGFQLSLGTGLSGLVAETGQLLFSEDAPNDPRNLFAQRDRELGIVTYLGLPIKIRDEVVGVLTFNTTVPRTYSPEELAYLSAFAEQAAIALENARLYDEIRQRAADLEARVRERTAALEEALRVKAQFLANMSHELRTPLNAVIGFAELLQQGSVGFLTPKQAQYVDRIHAGGKHLLALVSDILELSLVEAGKRGLQLEPVLLAPLVQEVLGLVGIQVTQKRLEVTTALEPQIPGVVADRRKLSQILSNLVGNAVRFIPDGGRITITARLAAGESPGTGKPRKPGAGEPSAPISRVPESPSQEEEKWVEIAVRDTGIGIKTEELERIFRGFEQVDASDARKYGGAGIGLTLVRTLVELHGGRVWAESEGPGRGARFVVRLPLLQAPHPKRVLVVEDEAPVLEALGMALGRAGYAVERAQNGSQALAALAAQPPDLLVLDIVLPDVDGWEVLRQVREGDRTRNLPVLVITGVDSIQADQAMARGADEFLAKPVSAQVLVETVSRLLRQPAGTRAAVGGAAAD